MIDTSGFSFGAFMTSSSFDPAALNPAALNNDTLIFKLKHLVQDERRITLEVLRFLREVE